MTENTHHKTQLSSTQGHFTYSAINDLQKDFIIPMSPEAYVPGSVS